MAAGGVALCSALARLAYVAEGEGGGPTSSAIIRRVKLVSCTSPSVVSEASRRDLMVHQLYKVWDLENGGAGVCPCAPYPLRP